MASYFKKIDGMKGGAMVNQANLNIVNTSTNDKDIFKYKSSDSKIPLQSFIIEGKVLYLQGAYDNERNLAFYSGIDRQTLVKFLGIGSKGGGVH